MSTLTASKTQQDCASETAAFYRAMLYKRSLRHGALVGCDIAYMCCMETSYSTLKNIVTLKSRFGLGSSSSKLIPFDRSRTGSYS